MNRSTPINIESLSKIEVIEASKVQEIVPSNAITGAPVILLLVYNASFEDIPLVAGTGQLAEEHVSDQSGDYISQSVAFSHAMNRRDVDNWLNANGHKDFIVKVTDRNLNIRIIGTVESPARLSAPMTNPASGRNEYAFTIYAEADERAPYLQTGESVINSGRNFSSNFDPNFFG